MHIAWIQAALYEPPTIFGWKLQPFSPYHAMILDAINSPFMLTGAVENPDPFDFLTAVHVCKSRWEDRYNILIAPEGIRAWKKKIKRADWSAEIAAFRMYQSESLNIPTTWSSGKGAEPAKAHGAYHLVVFGMRWLHMSESEAWNCPVARLICYREAYAEQETGKSDLVSEDEQRGIEILKKEKNAG